MSMHNRVQPHKATAKCRLCGAETKALNPSTGQVEMHPLCSECRARLVQEFEAATKQRNSQRRA